MVVALGGVALMVGGPGNAPGLGLALSVMMTIAFALSVPMHDKRFSARIAKVDLGRTRRTAGRATQKGDFRGSV
jgi:hypothetical protein